MGPLWFLSEEKTEHGLFTWDVPWSGQQVAHITFLISLARTLSHGIKLTTRVVKQYFFVFSKSNREWWEMSVSIPNAMQTPTYIKECSSPLIKVSPKLELLNSNLPFHLHKSDTWITAEQKR